MELHFLIHSATLCLLIETFSWIIFKVIIYGYVLIAISLLVFLLVFVVLICCFLLLLVFTFVAWCKFFSVIFRFFSFCFLVYSLYFLFCFISFCLVCGCCKDPLYQQTRYLFVLNWWSFKLKYTLKDLHFNLPPHFIFTVMFYIFICIP